MNRFFIFAFLAGMLCCTHDAAANGVPFSDIVVSPLARIGFAVVTMAALESLKQWKWFAEKALSVPLMRAAMALVLSLPAAIVAWAGGTSIEAAGTILMSSWLGSMGLNGLLGAVVNK